MRSLKHTSVDRLNAQRDRIARKLKPRGIFLRIPSLYWFCIYFGWIFLLGTFFYIIPSVFLQTPYTLQGQNVRIPFSYFLTLSITWSTCTLPTTLPSPTTTSNMMANLTYTPKSFALFVVCSLVGVSLNIAFLFSAARDWSLSTNKYVQLALGKDGGATSYLLIFLFYMVVLQLLSVIIVYIKSDSTIYYYEGAHRRIWMDGMRHGYCRMVGGGGSGESFCAFNSAYGDNNDDANAEGYTLDDYYRVSFFDFVIYIVSLVFVSVLWGKIIRDNNRLWQELGRKNGGGTLSSVSYPGGDEYGRTELTENGVGFPLGKISEEHRSDEISAMTDPTTGYDVPSRRGDVVAQASAYTGLETASGISGSKSSARSEEGSFASEPESDKDDGGGGKEGKGYQPPNLKARVEGLFKDLI